MSVETFTIGELADELTGGDERATRKLLNEAGAGLDENTINPAETVTRDVVIALEKLRTGDAVGRVLSRPLLGEPLSLEELMKSAEVTNKDIKRVKREFDELLKLMEASEEN